MRAQCVWHNWIKLPRWFWLHYDVQCKRNPLWIRIIHACLSKRIWNDRSLLGFEQTGRKHTNESGDANSPLPLVEVSAINIFRSLLNERLFDVNTQTCNNSWWILRFSSLCRLTSSPRVESRTRCSQYPINFWSSNSACNDSLLAECWNSAETALSIREHKCTTENVTSDN